MALSGVNRRPRLVVKCANTSVECLALYLDDSRPYRTSWRNFVREEIVDIVINRSLHEVIEQLYVGKWSATQNALKKSTDVIFASCALVTVCNVTVKAGRVCASPSREDLRKACTHVLIDCWDTFDEDLLGGKNAQRCACTINNCGTSHVTIVRFCELMGAILVRFQNRKGFIPFCWIRSLGDFLTSLTSRMRCN